MEESVVVYIVLAVINAPLFLLLGKFFFGCWEDFWEAIIFWITPDSYSFLTGRGWDDFCAEIKLFLFIAICVGCILGEFWLIVKFFDV